MSDPIPETREALTTLQGVITDELFGAMEKALPKTAREKFQIGQRVMPAPNTRTQFGIHHRQRPEVIGYGKAPDVVMLRFIGERIGRAWHMDFWEPIQ